MGSRWGNGNDARPQPTKDPAPIGGPGPTRSNRSGDIPTWQLWVVGALAVVVIGVPFFIVWWKFVRWLLAW